MSKQYRENIVQERAIKQIAKEKHIHLGGQPGVPLKEIWKRAETILQQMKDRHSLWLNKQKERLGSSVNNIPEENMEEMYTQGLFLFIKQKYRTIQATTPSQLFLFRERGYIEKMIEAYTHDFIMLLRQSFRADIYATTGFAIAREAYQHNPDILGTLLKRFPEFEKGMIVYALLNNPIHPEKSLEKMRKMFAELSPQFPEFEPRVIKHAVTHYPADPKKFLQQSRKKIAQLSLRFPEWDPFIVKRAVLYNPKAPVRFLQQVKKMAETLAMMFPDIPPGVIRRVVVNNASDAKQTLEKALERYPEIQKQFPQETKTMILWALLQYPTYPEEFFKKRKGLDPFGEEQI
jgi:hypothetical protein